MNLLSLLVFSPLIGMIILSLIPKTKVRMIKTTGFLATIPALIISFIFIIQYRLGANLANWDEKINWISMKPTLQYGNLFTINYELVVDGFSVVMLVLTSFISTMAAIASINIKKDWKGYFLLFLLLETGMLGVFTAGNGILFFLFFELTLIPAFFLIGKWGGTEREKASYHFLIYNGLGSALLLIVLTILFARTGTTNISALENIMSADHPQLVAGISESMKYGLFICLLVAFGIKLPIFPFHSWMVKTHVQAPPAIVMIHAGILLKIGAYGLIRFGLGIFPEQFTAFAPWIIVLGVINLLYGAFLAISQTDFKKVLAYSSISHMGMVLMGLGALNVSGIKGAIFQVISHGLISALLFFLVGVFYERTKTSEIVSLGGMAKSMPYTAGFLLVGAMASLGLPGLSGFVSEFMVFLGMYKEWPVLASIGALGIILTAVYMLRAVLGITFGYQNRDFGRVNDLTLVEYAPVVLLTSVILLIGLYPAALSDSIHATVHSILLSIGG